MPTTSLTDSTFAVSAIGGRTNAAGVAVADYTAEEARFASQILTEGYLTTGAFAVTPQTVAAMSVKVGSGTAKADYYVVDGDVGGQGRYVVRLDATSQTVTVPAADASQTRTDEVYLVVRDTVYDASSRALPTIGYRKGDLGGANPGPDAAWRASVLLARIVVAAGAQTIATVSDQRTAAAVAAPKMTLNGSDLAGLLAGKSATSHGHDPISSVMTSPARGRARWGSDVIHTVPNFTNTIVGFFIPQDGTGGDPLITRTTELPGDTFTLNASGIWAITATIRYNPGGPAGERYGAITLDGGVVTGHGGYGAGEPFTISLHTTCFIGAGGVIRVIAYQNTGATLYLTEQSGWRNIDFSLIRRTS